MSPNLGVLCEPAPTLDREPGVRPSANPDVLIRVPALPGQSRTDHRSLADAYRPVASGRRRRRLRREVRVAAAAVLFGLPMVGVLLKVWPSRPAFDEPRPMPALVASIPAPSETDREPSRPWPLVSISLEPAAGDRVPDFQAPVVRPAGFLLPDDGSEEPAHAGG